MTATIIGATSLIGNELLQLVLANTEFETVRILIRRPLALQHPKLEKQLVNFEDHESFKLALEGTSVLFCSIGTTQKKVKGDKVAYRKIDYDIPVKAAQLCKEIGCNVFVLVSAVGANSKSKNFYLQLKGEVEFTIRKIGIPSLQIMRPSMLLGNRKEFRLGEKIGSLLMRPFSFLLPSNYKPIQAVAVAHAMMIAGIEKKEGVTISHYKEMMSH